MEKGIRQDQIIELTEEQKKYVRRPEYEFKEMDLLEILRIIKDDDLEVDNVKHIITNLSKSVGNNTCGEVFEGWAFEAGILYHVLSYAGNITWCDVIRIYGEVYECQPEIEELLLNGWNPDPLIDELIVSKNPSYIGSF